ncbi:hypothetical protein [Thorsellia anophelis]|uniref:Uncharacterized protein n=1 Tax=Thorsellia anophelis DSM 18579 TaxID=1123402 RepID=A0A1H9ZR53_9GAMM|nr:hypothetical protein [Thorsellia anophelis]SES84136.1 hypothetical protein SAMN02583745_00657 [Thorsellia anophelis DSM 18579]
MSQVINLRLEPLTPPVPGMAKLLIKGWTGDDESLQFTIQRNQDHYFLDNVGEWGAGSVYHSISKLDKEGELFVLVFKPNLLDPLLKLTSASFRLTLSQADGKKSAGTIMMPNNLLGSQAAGSTPASTVTVETVEETIELQNISQVEIPEIIPDPVNIPPINQPPVPPAKKSRGLLYGLLALVLVLIIAGAAAAYFLGLVQNLFNTEPKASEPATVEEVSNVLNASVSPACSLEAAKTSANEVEFVKSCLKSSPSSQDLLQVIKDAKSSGFCTIAQRIYAYKSQSGDKTIGLAYAKEFDPASNISGGCFTADVETALYWYESVLATDPHNDEAKTRVLELKK